MQITTTARVRAGKLHVRRWTQIQDRLARCRDGEFLIVIERQHATRSSNQNAWYWGVIVEAISEHTGYEADEVHEILKAKFLPKKLAVATGNGEIVDEFVVGGSSAKLNKLEFGEYCEAIRRWAARLDIVIPDPS